MSKSRLIAILKGKSVKMERSLLPVERLAILCRCTTNHFIQEGSLVIADLLLDVLHPDVVGIGGPVRCHSSVGSTILRAEQQGRPLADSWFQSRQRTRYRKYG